MGNRTCSCGESCRRRVGSRGRQVPAACRGRYPAADWRFSALCWAPSRLQRRAALQRAYNLQVSQVDGLNVRLCTRSFRSRQDQLDLLRLESLRVGLGDSGSAARAHCPAAHAMSPALWAVGTPGVLKCWHTLSPGGERTCSCGESCLRRVGSREMACACNVEV
jgi:hypothetical protein